MKNAIPGFIQITNPDGGKVLLNVAQIESIGKDAVDGKGCNIVMAGYDDGHYCSKESFNAIKKRLTVAVMPQAIIAHKIAHPPLNIRMADAPDGGVEIEGGQPAQRAPSRHPHEAR